MLAAGDGARVVFAADDGSTGLEAWTSDGTTAGTQRISDLNPGSPGAAPQDFAAPGTHMFFSATDGRARHIPLPLGFP
jgi:ELWxxDGT repeat protein